MANPQIRSFTIAPSTVSPGGTAVGTVDAFDPDGRTALVRATVGDATVVTTLTVEGEPVPAPSFTEVDANGNPVASPTLEFTVDPQNPFKVFIKAKVL